jgi:drug/metabolite transporter (DMT)-like permease
VFSGLFPTIIALGLWNWAIARLGSISTSFYQLLQIVVPFILELVLFQQLYSAWIYSGIFLILLSTIWIGDSENKDPLVLETQNIDASRRHDFRNEKVELEPDICIC